MSGMTKPPRKRSGSYRDPDLSDKWLSEAEQRATGHGPRLTGPDATKIILRLVKEIRKINRETDR